MRMVPIPIDPWYTWKTEEVRCVKPTSGVYFPREIQWSSLLFPHVFSHVHPRVAKISFAKVATASLEWRLSRSPGESLVPGRWYCFNGDNYRRIVAIETAKRWNRSKIWNYFSRILLDFTFLSFFGLLYYMPVEMVIIKHDIDFVIDDYREC